MRPSALAPRPAAVLAPPSARRMPCVRPLPPRRVAPPPAAVATVDTEPSWSTTTAPLFITAALTSALTAAGDGKGALLALYLGRWTLLAAGTAALAAARRAPPAAAAVAGVAVAAAGAAAHAAATATLPSIAITPVYAAFVANTVVIPTAVAAAITRAAPAADVAVAIARGLGIIAAGWLLAKRWAAVQDDAWQDAFEEVKVERKEVVVVAAPAATTIAASTTSPLALPSPSESYEATSTPPSSTVTSLRTSLADAEDRAAALAASHARVTAALRTSQRRLTDAQARHDALLAAVGTAPYTPPRLHAALTAAVGALASARAELAAADARLASRDATVDGLRRAVASARAAAAHARLVGGEKKTGVSLSEVMAAATAPGGGVTPEEKEAAAEPGWHGALRDAGEDAEGSGCE